MDILAIMIFKNFRGMYLRMNLMLDKLTH